MIGCIESIIKVKEGKLTLRKVITEIMTSIRRSCETLNTSLCNLTSTSISSTPFGFFYFSTKFLSADLANEEQLSYVVSFFTINGEQFLGLEGCRHAKNTLWPEISLWVSQLRIFLFRVLFRAVIKL